LKISRQLYEKIINLLHDEEIEIPQEAPVLKLALNDKTLEKISETIPKVVENIDRDEQNDAKQFLTSLVNNAIKVRDGIKNNSPEIRDSLLSFIIAYVNRWGFNKTLLANIIQNIPELYQLDNEVYLLSNSNEAMEIASYAPDKAVKTLEEYFKFILEKAYYQENTFILPVLGADIRISDDEILRHLIRFKMTNKATELLREKLKHTYTILEASDNKMIITPNTQFVVDNRTKFNVRPIHIIRYIEAGDIAVDTIIKTPVGTLKVPNLGTVGTLPTIQNKALKILNKTILIFHDEFQYLKNTAKKNKFTVIIPDDVPISDKVSFTLELYRKSPLEESKIAFIATGDPNTVNFSLYLKSEMNLHTKVPEDKIKQLLEKYGMENAKIEIRDSIIHIEYEDQPSDPIAALIKIGSFIKDVTTEHNNMQQNISPQSYLAGVLLLSTLYRNGQRDVEELSEATGKPIIEILSEISEYLSKYNIFIDPKMIITRPDKFVETLVENRYLTFDENLDLILFGEKLENLILQLPQLNNDPEIYDMIDTLKEEVAKIYYNIFARTPLEDIPAEKITEETVKTYLKIRAPMNISTLKITLPNGASVWSMIPDEMKEKVITDAIKSTIEIIKEINGSTLVSELPDRRTIWEALPTAIKWKLAEQLKYQDAQTIESKVNIKLTKEDKRILASIYCRTLGVSQCTEYVANEIPDAIRLSSKVKVTEDEEGKVLDIGLYKVQIESIDRESVTFIIYDKFKDKKYKITAKTLPEAIIKIPEDEYATIST